MRISCQSVDRAFSPPFRISGHDFTHITVIEVEVETDGLVGRGEAVGVHYRPGENDVQIRHAIERIAGASGLPLLRGDLPALLPAGGARNALDCALWDLEAKQTGLRAWQLAGFEALAPVVSAATVSIGSAAAMAERAKVYADFPQLKIKLGGRDGADSKRLQAVRHARPDAELVVDANQGWDPAELGARVDDCAALGVTLIEQPLPAGADSILLEFESPVPLCADESCQTAASLPQLAGKYEFINIKLDKTGGLSHALELAELGRAMGFRIMTGCMGGSSLAMAPGMILAQLCEYVDLDTPLLLAADIEHGLRYDAGVMSRPDPALWG